MQPEAAPEGHRSAPGAGTEANLEQLAVSARDGDAVALDRLLEQIRPDVLRRCAKFLPNALDAEDACQNALLAVARGISTFQGRARFSTWLYQVTSHSALDTYRKLKRRGVELAHAPSSGVLDRRDPRTTSVIAGTRIDLLEALEGMDPRFSEPVVLRDLCGLDYAEIAAQLELAPGTVRSRIHEARRRLRALLSR